MGPPFRRRQVRHNSAQGFRNAAPYDSRTGEDAPLWPTVQIKIAVADEEILPGDSGVVVVWRNEDKDSKPEKTRDRIRVWYDWSTSTKIIEGEEVVIVEFPDENVWRVFKDRVGAITLERCSDQETVIAADVYLSEELGFLSDNKGKVIMVRGSAILPEDCWTIMDETDCPPEICPSVCAMPESCTACYGCYKLTHCEAPFEEIITSPANMCDDTGRNRDFPFEVAIATGGVVRLSDDHCYTVEHSPTCNGSQDVTVIGLAESCEACLQCLQLTPCFGEIKVPQWYYQDNHKLSEGDVIKVNGECLEVTYVGDCLVDNPNQLVDGYEIVDDCPSCGCYAFTACTEYTQGDSLVVRSAVDKDGDPVDLEELKGKVALTSAGFCFEVKGATDVCEGAVDIIILETYDSGDCEDCGPWRLKGCGVPDLWVAQDMGQYERLTVIKNAVDGYCYEVRDQDPTVGPPYDDFTVELVYPLPKNCDDCGFPLYKMDPVCPDCEDITGGSDDCELEVGSGGSPKVTDEDLSASVGQFIKYEDICYHVSVTDKDDTKTLDAPFSYTGPFPNCNICQKTCLWVVTNVREFGDELLQEKKKIIVDAICDTDEKPIIGIEDCP
jgi:hypothetical protein